MSSNFPAIFAQKQMKRTILISAVSAIIIIFCIIPGYLYPIFGILDAVDRQITIALNFNGGTVLDAILYAMSSRITCSIFVLSIIALFWNRKSKLRKYIVIILGHCPKFCVNVNRIQL